VWQVLGLAFCKKPPQPKYIRKRHPYSLVLIHGFENT